MVGLGSMGKQRIRCLQAPGHRDIVAMDLGGGARMASGIRGATMRQRVDTITPDVPINAPTTDVPG